MLFVCNILKLTISYAQLGTYFSFAYESDVNSKAQESDENILHSAFYIKTHQYGSNCFGSSNTPVDPKELFVYKAFEYMGVGPKVHFISSLIDETGFYIATRDLNLPLSLKVKTSFMTFKQLKPQWELSIKQSNTLPQYGVDQKGLLMLAIFSEIFRFDDLIDNDNNFGCVISPKNNQKSYFWNVIDFKVRKGFTYRDCRLHNVLYSYRKLADDTYPLLKKVVDASDEVLLKMTYDIIKQLNSKENASNIEESINSAYSFVLRYLANEFDKLVYTEKRSELFNCWFRGLEKYISESNSFLFNKLNNLHLHDKGDLGRYALGVLDNLENLEEEVVRQLEKIEESNSCSIVNRNRFFYGKIKIEGEGKPENEELSGANKQESSRIFSEGVCSK